MTGDGNVAMVTEGQSAGENRIPFQFVEHEPGATAGSQPSQGREVWRDLGTPRPGSRIEKWDPPIADLRPA
jgi:hypothetical protein